MNENDPAHKITDRPPGFSKPACQQRVQIMDYANSHSLIPTYPFPQRDRHDAPWLADEPVPCVTAVINDIIVMTKHAIG
jgi:hypothetical protein